MDKSIELADKWAEKLANVVSQYGSNVADLVLTMGRVDAASKIIMGVLWLIAGGLLHYFFTKSITAWAVKYQDESDGLSWGAWAVSMILFSFPLYFAATRLTGIYAWVGLYRPEIYLAAKALGWN